MEDKYVVTAPWAVEPDSYTGCVSIAVLSTNMDVIKNIAHALVRLYSKGSYRWKLVLHGASHVENLNANVAMDFVVLALDTIDSVGIEWARSMVALYERRIQPLWVAQIHPNIHRRRRVVLVNASGLNAFDDEFIREELSRFLDESKLELMTSKVFKPDDAACLARSLLKHMVLKLTL